MSGPTLPSPRAPWLIYAAGEGPACARLNCRKNSRSSTRSQGPNIDGVLIQWGDRLFYPGNRIVKVKPQPKLAGGSAQQRAAGNPAANAMPWSWPPPLL